MQSTYIALSVVISVMLALPQQVARCQSDAPVGDLPSVEDVVAANRNAVAGEKNVQAVKAISFQLGPQRIAVNRDGRLKSTMGFQPPVVFESILVQANGVRRNSRGRVSAVNGAERFRWTSLARLSSGLFSLNNIGLPLEMNGLRSFGPERHYQLTARDGVCTLSFYVDSTDLLLKRMVVTSADKTRGRCEYVFELGPPQEVDGFRLPSQIHVSELGVSGTFSPQAYPLQNVVLNPELPPDTFTAVDIHAGEWSVEQGRLTGQVLAVGAYEPYKIVRLFTNWVEADMVAAGFRSGENLTLTIGERQFDTQFFMTEDDANSSGTAWSTGTILLSNTPQVLVYYIYFNTMPDERFHELQDAFAVMMPLELRQKTDQGEE